MIQGAGALGLAGATFDKPERKFGGAGQVEKKRACGRPGWPANALTPGNRWEDAPNKVKQLRQNCGKRLSGASRKSQIEA